MELFQKHQKFILIPPQDADNVWRLIRIRYEDLMYFISIFRGIVLIPTLKT